MAKELRVLRSEKEVRCDVFLEAQRKRLLETLNDDMAIVVCAFKLVEVLVELTVY
ncbi:hypothetical protein M378DRAFT_158156 [Amanita muscaria Koide BX008]|uniref:Uncharacterized protein n=1 Tax=Amanita muscaria (strain Koide BX008) TaxID=946122 RepID=A0A0C2SXW8_AMAMK|nr:hypothetical protein M378DRAFT_158156 [Amanita muscaria Koide BX008]